MKQNNLSRFSRLTGDSSQLIEKLNKVASVHFYEQRQTIIYKGDEVGGIYLVESGCLRVYTMDMEGNESTLYKIHPGESCLLAMNCIFSKMRYPAWVSCVSPLTKVIVISGAVYRELYESESSVRNFTMEVLSHRVFNLMSALDEALSFTMEQRIASYLIRKADLTRELNVLHKDIAAELGTAREVVSRILKEMEKQGYLSLGRGTITVQSIEGLNRYLQE